METEHSDEDLITDPPQPMETKHCDDCNKELTLNPNNWSNHEKWHIRTVMKIELYKLEHPEQS